mgnify:FL=1
MNWKTKLDERQEQKLLKIEHYGFWLLFGLIFIDVLLMPFLTKLSSMALTAGIFLVVCFFMIIACAWNGIFDRHFKMGWKTTLGTALATGIVMTVIISIQNHLLYNSDWFHVLMAGIFTGIFTGLLTGIIMLILTASTKKRQRTLEQEPKDED